MKKMYVQPQISSVVVEGNCDILEHSGTLNLGSMGSQSLGSVNSDYSTSSASAWDSSNND